MTTKTKIPVSGKRKAVKARKMWHVCIYRDIIAERIASITIKARKGAV